MKAIQLQIPAHADYIDLVRVCLYGVAAKLGYSYEAIEDMKVAVSEACNNAVSHGRAADGDSVVEIAFEPGDDALIIRVTNYGPSFAYDEARHKAEPLRADDASGLRVGGLGIYLMEALMDEVAVDSDRQRTVVRLVKYRGQGVCPMNTVTCPLTELDCRV